VGLDIRIFLERLVNDAAIGLAENSLTQDLRGGENQILLGSDDSQFQFKVTLR
jgi:hypothetical protein